MKYLSDDSLARNLGALSHPARLRILRELAARPACCCKDVVARLDLAQSTVSQHLRILVDSGLVAYEPDRQRSRYSLNRDALGELHLAVEALAQFDQPATTQADGMTRG